MPDLRPEPGEVEAGAVVGNMAGRAGSSAHFGWTDGGRRGGMPAGGMVAALTADILELRRPGGILKAALVLQSHDLAADTVRIPMMADVHQGRPGVGVSAADPRPVRLRVAVLTDSRAHEMVAVGDREPGELVHQPFLGDAAQVDRLDAVRCWVLGRLRTERDAPHLREP